MSLCAHWLTGSCTHAHMNTAHKHSLDSLRFSLTRQDLHTAKEEMRCGPKSIFLILFPTSAVWHSMIMIPLLFFFLSSWVFMTGRLGAVIPVLYTTWRRPAVRSQRAWLDVYIAAMLSSAPKVFILKVEEVTVITDLSICVSTTGI